MFPFLPETVLLESDQHLEIYTFSASQLQSQPLRHWAMAQMAELDMILLCTKNLSPNDDTHSLLHRKMHYPLPVLSHSSPT
jgi:hypothetical protein